MSLKANIIQEIQEQKEFLKLPEDKRALILEYLDEELKDISIKKIMLHPFYITNLQKRLKEKFKEIVGEA